eukprot:238086_1
MGVCFGTNNQSNKIKLPVFVKVINQYPFCGTIHVKLKTSEWDGYQFIYPLDHVIEDIKTYLQTYHKNLDYLLYKVVSDDTTYSWNDEQLHQILLANSIVKDATDSITELYFVCEQQMTIPIKAIYMDHMLGPGFHDYFKMNIIYSNNYTMNDLLSDMTTRVNDRHAPHLYDCNDIFVSINANTKCTLDEFEPIPFSVIDRINKSGLNIVCFNKKEHVYQ